MRRIGNEIDVNKFLWSDPTQNTQAALKEVNARMLIEAIEFIRAIAVVWVFWMALKIAMQSWAEVTVWQRRRLILGSLFALAIYGIFVSNWWPAVPNAWLEIFQEFNDKIRTISGKPLFAFPIRKPMVICTHLGLIFSAFAIGLVVAKPAKTIAEFREKSKSLAHLLYPCAAVLLFHVVCVAVWQLRTAALLSDNADAEQVRHLGATVVINTAVCYVCILFAFHVPAVSAVTSQLNTYFDRAGFPEEDKEKWFVDHKLKDSWLQFYADIFAVLAPLVASFPLAKLLVLAFT
jgi:hypothetical protein